MMYSRYCYDDQDTQVGTYAIKFKLVEPVWPLSSQLGKLRYTFDFFFQTPGLRGDSPMHP